MANPYHHALSSVKRFGGAADDYIKIHAWFDESKSHFAGPQHRALRHHTQGIFECERVFGVTITNSDGKVVPVRWIGEQHVNEDLGRIPSLSEWLAAIPYASWMNRSQRLSRELGNEDLI